MQKFTSVFHKYIASKFISKIILKNAIYFKHWGIFIYINKFNGN